MCQYLLAIALRLLASAPLGDRPSSSQHQHRWAIAVNIAERKVTLFLPGFDKTQVKLIQSGPEVTVEAGNQRRNISLPPELSGR
ncbi:MAG: hypothetical protein IGS16_06555 [Thermoleptolyngbya sp. C42_A2020_037]|nr:hypothetical protein [Thermoleptolyngbya sp. C42_A2020_037]